MADVYDFDNFDYDFHTCIPSLVGVCCFDDCCDYCVCQYCGYLICCLPMTGWYILAYVCSALVCHCMCDMTDGDWFRNTETCYWCWCMICIPCMIPKKKFIELGRERIQTPTTSEHPVMLEYRRKLNERQ